MKRLTISILLILFVVSYHTPAYSQTINEADTELCETLKYALINSLKGPVDQAIDELYKDDKQAPENLTWASYDTEIIKIKQLYGVGGAYEITLKVTPYYRAHITYGEVQIVVSSAGELLDYEHLKTYPIVDFN